MSEKTSIAIELNLIFDNYTTDMSVITKEIGLEPTDCKNKRETRNNLYKDDNIQGYWSIVTDYVETYNATDVIEIMIEKINPYLKNIKKVLENYRGEANFCLISYINDNVPGVYFDREFLEIVELLKASVEIDMYATLEEVEYLTY